VSGYLLDTNVVSELTSDNPEPQVAAFLDLRADQWLSAVVLHELEFGLQQLPGGRRRERMYEDHYQFLSAFENRIVPLDSLAAEFAAISRAEARRNGRPVDVADALIAGTAIANEMTVVTRDVTDFGALGVEIINPWEYETS